MKVNVKRIHSRLEEIYQCGKEEDGTFTRMAYSPEDVKGRETFMNYFRQLGIEPRVDEAGNIHARLEGEDPALPAILTGSHLDTVPDGGRYDGVVGCVSGLEVVETLVENARRLRHPLEVIVFTDEEGFRFGSGLLGSSAICGQELILKNRTWIYMEIREQMSSNPTELQWQMRQKQKWIRGMCIASWNFT